LANDGASGFAGRAGAGVPEGGEALESAVGIPAVCPGWGTGGFTGS